jgi:hypothetical protein
MNWTFKNGMNWGNFLSSRSDHGGMKMRRFIKIGWYSILLAGAMCGDKAVDSSAASGICNPAPLKIGNSWVYRSYSHQRSGALSRSYLYLTIIDTFSRGIRKAYILQVKDSLYYFSLAGGVLPAGGNSYYIDTLFDNGDSIRIAGPDPFPSDAEILDHFIPTAFSLAPHFTRQCLSGANSNNYIVNNKSLAAIHLVTSLSSNPSGGILGGYCERWYAENIGLIAINYFIDMGGNTQGWRTTRELVRFNSDSITVSGASIFDTAQIDP